MKNLYTNNKHLLIFLSILILTFFVRLIGLDIIPSGINQDEAMGALDALALSQYGTDRFGTYFPVHFSAWGYSQMSVLLAYCMIPFIKLLGFSIITIRLPLAIISSCSVYIIYKISQKYFSNKLALVIMALTAINPWQIMQSRWALDCNLFPHVFLLAFYLLLLGLEKSRYLYISMIFFGLTFYCYGIAIYTVPVFLFVFAAYCLYHKHLSWKNIFFCILIFAIVVLPEVIVMGINVLGLNTIQTPFFTMQAFPESVRGSDILIMNFSMLQLFKNCASLLTQVFLQFPDHLFNTLPAFGPLYHISTPFVLIGIVTFTKKLFTSHVSLQRARDLALWGFFLSGIWVGILTYEVNVNRINIIFYPLIILTGYGLAQVHRFIKNMKYKNHFKNGCLVLYTLYFLLFCNTYFTSFADDIKLYFNTDFLSIMSEADALEEYDTLYVTGNMGWQFNPDMAEILTQYSCSIDAHYFQGQTNNHNEQLLLPYKERYHFMEYNAYPYDTTQSIYILHETDLSDFPFPYTIVLNHTTYKGITIIQ